MTELPPKPRFEHASTSELGRPSFKKSMLEYAKNRARLLLEATSIQGTLEEVGMADMRKNASLLENLSREVEMRESEPLCMVCMPVALLGEDPEMIRRTVEMIGSSEVSEVGNIELVLWANAKYHGGNEEAVHREAAEKYQALRDSLMELDAPGMKIKTALQIFPIEEFSMSRLRRNYMDAAVMTAFEENYSYDHPVMWLDADTTQMSTHTIQALSQGVRDHEALFMHANLRYNLDWAKGKPLSELDDAARAVAIHEIHRRQTEREMDEYEVLGYLEESGLAFSIGTYLEVGGVKTEHPINESSNMVYTERTANFLESDPSTTWPYKFVKSAHLGLSARRHYEAVKQGGPQRLVKAGPSGYRLFNDMGSHPNETLRISRKEMRGVLWHSDRKYRKDVDRSVAFDAERWRRSQTIAKQVIKRYF